MKKVLIAAVFPLVLAGCTQTFNVESATARVQQACSAFALGQIAYDVFAEQTGLNPNANVTEAIKIVQIVCSFTRAQASEIVIESNI